MKIFARVIVHFEKRVLFCSYYPSQEECLAPGILEIQLQQFFCIIMGMFCGTHFTWEVLRIAFNIDPAFGSVELEFHHLLAVIPIVLSSPPPRALRLDLWS